MPLGLALLLLCIALFMFCRGSGRTARLVFTLAIIWIWLWSTPIWSDFIRGTLESKYPYHPAAECSKADAIVVLGGGVRGFAGSRFPAIDLNRAADRELFASQLYKAGKADVVILSGGADPIYRTGAAAVGMKVFLISLGIPSRIIHIGTKSRNTVENVEEVVEMVKPLKGKSILLVTSALHMKRASWLFSRSGLEVIPAPSDFEVVNIPFSFYRLLPDAEALENSSRAAREYIGLLAHKLGFH
jgi:uncharacterized SAM-binding protein YcdF (DUF218 family)